MIGITANPAVPNLASTNGKQRLLTSRDCKSIYPIQRAYHKILAEAP